MNRLLLNLILALPVGGDPFTDGLQHYAAKEYAQAVASFRQALEVTPDDPRLNYNLALALWRIGAMEAAETAAEKAAALSQGRLDARRDGILGNIRYDQARQIADAKAPPARAPGSGAGVPEQGSGPDLQKALELVGQSKDHFLRGAMASQPVDPVLLRNLERALVLEEELKKRQQEQDDKQQDDQKQADQKQDDKQQDDKQQDDKKQDDQKQDQGDEQDDKNKQKPDPKSDQDKQDEQQKEPDPESRKKDEQEPPKPEEGEDEKKPKKPQEAQQAPGEHDPDKELTPEQRQQLLKQLEKFEENLQKLKAARKASRPKVKKDW